MDLIEYITKQISWSGSTFGKGRRTEGILKHIAKESEEIRENPLDLIEWVDIITLAIDGAWRAGYSPDHIFNAMKDKLEVNINREWNVPDSENEAVEHIRTESKVADRYNDQIDRGINPFQ
jgi:hypothetical protein